MRLDVIMDLFMQVQELDPVKDKDRITKLQEETKKMTENANMHYKNAYEATFKYLKDNFQVVTITQ
jgi:hypothetical protein